MSLILAFRANKYTNSNLCLTKYTDFLYTNSTVKPIISSYITKSSLIIMLYMTIGLESWTILRSHYYSSLSLQPFMWWVWMNWNSIVLSYSKGTSLSHWVILSDDTIQHHKERKCPKVKGMFFYITNNGGPLVKK